MSVNRHNGVVFRNILARKIKAKRKSKNLKQTDMASRLGMSASMYSKIEQGHGTSLYNYYKICKLINANLGKLVKAAELEVERMKDESMPLDGWLDMTPEERSSYAQRFRATAIELIASRVRRLGISHKELADRTGYTKAWVSNALNLKGAGSFAAVVELSTAVGYPPSFFALMAEDLIALEDEHLDLLEPRDEEE